ncbi:kinase suppressor of Ras 2 isoform X1 [Macrosteles quadrilineatus]|uniref:kinase suppressor of Ras 2 isoform X1 n=1 Tax=Macrosteles quadrilineatus TaxID=74068 RepID=UPI0023E0E6DB|nr:kinase suppressor of Ras 2 isoform X1 [Macrosteles quadrilineatus]
MADEDPELEVRRALDVVQSMIDISADRLEGLRTQCATSAELTQHEIRTLEGKLIKLFSRQLILKAKLKDDGTPAEIKHVPSLRQWLQVVGLSPDSVQIVTYKVRSLEALQSVTERELRTLLSEQPQRDEELRRLSHALHNLKRYTDILHRGDSENVEALYWDSWDRRVVVGGGSSPRPPRSRAGRCSVPSEESLHPSERAPLSPPLPPYPYTTPPSTPPVGKGKLGEKVRFPTTPPPRRKHQTGLPTLYPEPQPLTKSKSHESQLANKVDGDTASTGSRTVERRGRLPTEPGPPLVSSPIKSPPPPAPVPATAAPPLDDNTFKSSLQVPKSPRTPTISRGMGHVINHRFTKTFKMMTTCDYCDKQMFIGTGLKCKECKYKCHRDCEPKVPPSCGLPRELVDEFRRTITGNQDVFAPSQSPIINRPSPSHNPLTRRDRKTINVPPFPVNNKNGGLDSSSNTSSCNSSTPSSPALVPSHTPAAIITKHQQFHFPDVVTLQTHPLERSQDSDRTVSGSVSTDSEHTPVRVDSQDSQVSDSENVDNRGWPRQNSLSMREWDIPFDELKMGEAIGTGHFGTVYRGNWHGDVAIKVLNMNYMDDDKTFEAFKLEVAIFRKTRHENVVLFMGACMKPPRLAIVTSMCKGMTLYTHIHLCKDKFNMNKTTSVAQQISQGMGYLHARGIIHKDLKTKNIFLENGKVIITDFGLFSVTKLCFANKKVDGLSIPKGWLCYLAPEIIRDLRAHQKPDDEELPFSKFSDVYAFGTVWYELLCGEWPFKGQPPETIIWQVGKGVKQPLANLQASRDVKDILMLCWSYQPNERPDFIRLLKTLEKLPKKRLARSPSHPIHLSRSAESVF